MPSRPTLLTVVCLATCATPAAVVAQEDTDAAEAEASGATSAGWYPIGADDERDRTISVEVDATGQVVSFDDADLLPTDESSQEQIQDTDDRTTYGDTWLTIAAFASPIPEVRMDLEMGALARWGSRAATSSVVLAAASVGADLVDGDAFRLSARAGRQRFEIGGADTDYLLHGMVDGFTAEAEVVDILTLRVLAFDLFSPQPFPEDRHSRFWDRPQGEAPSGQRGETNTIRTGAVLESVDQLVDGLAARLFFFHATVGGSVRDSGTGSDISEGGLLGNFRDRDYLQMMGARIGYERPVGEQVSIGGFAEFARSSGVDRKEMTAVDIDLEGLSFGLGLNIAYEIGAGRLGLSGEWHRMEGAEYSVNGLEFSRGFVSMYGQEIGGLASASLAGTRPSATLDRYGVLHNPDDVDRSAGTDFAHIALELECRDTELDLGFWTYTDTRSTGFDQTTLDAIEPPPEHSREEFAAQRRAGLSLGNEIDVTIRQVVRDYAAVFVRGGIFFPGDYYDVEISRVVTPEAIEGNRRLGGGDTSFWAVAAGAEFGFGYGRER